mmetsp:Transcript_27101/g.38840  ORF Transcript_27101/g.38840 Transcript_27101/m.38840 type:complete len:692 (+) Transcript_27101:99-2174(+)
MALFLASALLFGPSCMHAFLTRSIPGARPAFVHREQEHSYQQHRMIGNKISRNMGAASSESSTSSDTRKSKKTLEYDLTYDSELIRNFSIIAHIDHGKSTLADRLLEMTETVAARDMEAQLLDNMDLERERGITIKLQAARVRHKSVVDQKWYTLNLIDTPGHVDFGYEVSRSLAACEGALLVVDAAQGIEAQTLANVYLAIENNLEIIPVINKIDLPAADPERVKEEIETTVGLDTSRAVLASAKAGIGILEILESIVKYVPPPPASTGGPTRALIFDSLYDSYRGVVVFFRVMDGELTKGTKIRFLASGAEHDITEVGILMPQQVPVTSLRAGEVGYLCGSIKDVNDAPVGDTITLASQYKAGIASGNPVEMLPGYADSVPMVYCGLFPVDADDYEKLRDSIGKLKLNDAALTYEPENSQAMGFGFRCGFLGLLHMEIVQERLQREYDVDLIVTAPSVVYQVKNIEDNTITLIDSPSKMPDLVRNDIALEPYVKVEILTPSEYNGPIIELGQERRGILKDINYLTPTRSTIVYELPLAEVITDFFDELKGRTKGYASMEYQLLDYRESDLVRLDIKINGEDASPLATIVHRDKSQSVGRGLVNSLKDLIPRAMFKIPIQACIGPKVIASAQISPMRKDVLAKCYGGDITRKKKLLQKQAKGKKRMKALGKVNVPQEAFMAVLKLNKTAE